MMRHEHELGHYTLAGQRWHPSVLSDAPWDYISRADAAIFGLSTGLGWTPVDSDGDESEDEDWDDEDEDEEENEPDREDTGEPPLHT